MGKRGRKLRQHSLDAVNHLDGIGSGLALDVEEDRRSEVLPGGELAVLHSVDDPSHVAQHHRCSVAVRHDDRFVGAARQQLIVRVDGVVMCRSVEAAFGRVEAVAHQGIAQVFQVDPVSGQGRRVSLNADRRLLSAGDAHQADSRDLRDLRREARICQVLDLRKRDLARGQRQGEDRGIRRIGLAVDGRGRKVRRQIALCRIDCRLNLLLGDVDVESQLKLHDDHRDPAGARRGHLGESGKLAELPLQRCGDG